MGLSARNGIKKSFLVDFLPKAVKNFRLDAKEGNEAIFDLTFFCDRCLFKKVEEKMYFLFLINFFRPIDSNPKIFSRFFQQILFEQGTILTKAAVSNAF